MKKITLLILTLLFSLAGYSQFPTPGTEGFEGTTGPDLAAPTTPSPWTLGTGATGNQWAVFDNGVGLGQRWGINNSVATPPIVYAGTNAAYINRENIGLGNTSEDYLATPLITVPTNGQVRFFARTFSNGNTGTLYQVKVASVGSTQNAPASYTTLLAEYTEDQLTLDPDGVQNAFNVYTEKVIDFPASMIGQQVYVAFVMKFTQTTTGISGDRWLLDNVRISQKCLAPTGLTATGVLYNQATLSWANPSGATSWEIEIVPVAAAPTGVGTIYNGTLPYIATGLTPNTPYKYYVRALCGDGINSTWAGPTTFTTPIAPPICGGNYLDAGLVAGNYSNNTDSTITICPVTPGDVVTVTFTSFNTEANADGMYVFNGNTIAAPIIASTNPAGTVPGGLAGSYWGTTIPGPFTSSSPDGCLTFRFRSGASVVASGWAANITCGLPPSCSKPISVTRSAVTATSVNLGWTNTNAATSWHVLALPCGSPAPTAASTGWVIATTNPYVLTGLSADTCYDFYIRAACSPTDFSEWTTPVSATTLIVPPACGGTFSDTGGSSANYANNSNSIVTICPITPGDVVTVTFTSFNTQATADGLYIFNGNSITAPLISSGNPAGTVPGGLAGAYWGTANPGSFTSTSADGCLTFRFRSGASVNAAGWTSNVTCAPPPTCPKPQSILTSAVTYNSATVAWTETGTATAWQVLALPCGSPFPTASATGWVSTTANPYVLTGLNSETCYDIYVRSACSVSDISTWAGPKSITTLITPPLCGGTFVDNGGTAGNYLNNSNVTYTICPSVPGEIVTVTFTSFNLENNIDFLRVYDGTSAAAVLLGSYTGNTLPPQFEASPLTGCLTFVFTSDGSITGTGWNANITCGPPPTCPKPTNLVATAINANSSNLTWTENGTATSWEVIVQPAGTGMPAPTAVGVLVTSPSYVAPGLTPGVNYEFWVRAVCSSTDSSNWNGPRTFFVTTTCIDSQPFCGESGSIYTNTTNIPSLGTIGCLFTTPNPAWFYFQVANSGPLNFQIHQGSNAPNYNNQDVDFIAYGPFPDLSAACGNLAPTVACSYSAAATENFNIPNAIAGQIYVVMITNYSNQPGTVVFNQTNTTSTGSGSTNCEIVCSIDLGPDVVVCGTTYTITSTTQGATGYKWYFNGVLIPGATASTLTVTASGDYKCTIQCGLNSEFDVINVTFTSPTVPTFDPINNICQNSSSPALPLISTNGITGTWLPATINTSAIGTTTYNFTPDATPTQTCVATTSLTVTIVGQITPEFTAISNICQNGTAPALPLASNNAITGTWNPSVISTSTGGTTTYTFTPDTSISSQACAVSTSLNVTIDAPVITTFNPIAAICINDAAPTLPTTSNEGIAGTWSPLVIDTTVAGTQVYSFTPNTGICATSATLSVTINPLIVPTFNPIASICKDFTGPALPSVSTNGFTGTWNPLTIDTSAVGTFVYTFNPDAGQCAAVTTISVTINAPTVPVFTQLPSVCQGGTAPTFVLTSTNGISGTWNPSIINTSVTGTSTYTFTPNSGVCATTTTMDITVIELPVIGSIASVTSCNSYSLPALPVGNYYTGPGGTGTLLNADASVTASQTIYVYATSGTTPSCTDEESFLVTIVPSPQFTITGGCQGVNYILEVVPGNFDILLANYEWTDSSSNIVGTNSPTLQVATTGDYSCKVTFNECFNSQSFSANEVSCLIPKGISPNGDSLNDTFDLTGFNVKELSIYNRYGTKVYSKKTYTNQWVGQSDKGDELPDGTYYYVIERNGAASKSGWVYINREK